MQQSIVEYSLTLTVNFHKKIRSLQNLVYGKALLLHWTSSCEKAQLFDKHLVGLGLWTKKEKNISEFCCHKMTWAGELTVCS